MSDKKLLTESEIRRFMRLAAIEPLFTNVVKENYMEDPSMQSADSAEKDMPADTAPTDMGSEAEGGDLDSLEQEFKSEVEKLLNDPKFAELKSSGRVSIDSGESDESEETPDMEAPEQDEEQDEGGMAEYGMNEEDEEESDEEESEEEESEEGEEESDEEEGEEESEEEDEEESDEEEDEEAEYQMEGLSEDELVETVLKRVSQRLIQEAKKSPKSKMKAKIAGKAPPTTNTNGKKNGLAGHGPGKKSWGVSGVKDDNWKEGIRNKTKVLKPLAPNGKDIKTHGKSSKMTSKGKNTKKV